MALHRVSDRFHLLNSTGEQPPQAMNDPMQCGAQVHPLCIEAARQLKEHLHALPQWTAEVEAGKMFGVLVCQDAQGQTGFLAAYSGQIGGRADWPWFVPAVFDYLQPDGHFKREEQAISAINHRVAALESASAYATLRLHLRQLKAEQERETQTYKAAMAEAKQRRDEQRRQSADAASLERESQFQKAELRRMKARWRERISEAEAELQPMETAIGALKQERAARSDALQRWLFDQFQMLNDRGCRRTLTDIFRPTSQRVPPSGAGECCAPKLLQYAYSHALRPLQIAEFWQGRSPKMEIRHHDQFYPACRGKCKPILEWMISRPPTKPTQPTLPTLPTPPTRPTIPILSQSPSFLVLTKPSGLLSVPGKSGAPSVESLLRERYGEVYMVHRLDMETSGLMVVALTPEAYHHLQRQFLARDIYKRYVAVLDGELPPDRLQGTISLPLRPDLMDRPRQLVDHEHGREATTSYRVLRVKDGRTLVELTPHTGRTHQLRMHCAHAEGLGLPIVGDTLYGRLSDRLYLHAAELRFRHPSTGELLTFHSPAPFLF